MYLDLLLLLKPCENISFSFFLTGRREQNMNIMLRIALKCSLVFYSVSKASFAINGLHCWMHTTRVLAR